MAEPLHPVTRRELLFGFKRPQQIPDASREAMDQESTPLHVPGGAFTRRQFLRLAALSAAGAGLDTIRRHPVISQALKALAVRPLGLDRFGNDIAGQLKPDIKGRELPSEFAEGIWKKYFQSRETTIPESSWTTTYRRIEKAADYYYRINGIKEPFADYCTKFFDQLYQTSQEQGLDFTILVELFGWTQKPDEIVPDSVMALPQILSSLASVAGQEDKMKEAWTKAILSPSLAAHIDGYLTLGSQDVESIVVARVLRDNPQLRQELSKKYPQACASLDKLLKIDDEREEKREVLSQTVEEYLKKYSRTLDIFWDTESAEKAFAAIGIGDRLGLWQRTHYAIPLLYYDDEFQNLHKYSGRTDPRIEQEAANNTKAFYRRQEDRNGFILRNQILNPAMLSYLKQSAGEDREALASIEMMEQARRDFSVAGDNCQIADLQAYSATGKLDGNVDYQLKTAVAMIKWYSDTIEKRFNYAVNPADPTTVWRRIWEIMAIRESSGIYYYSTSFAKDKAAYPYETEQVLSGIGRLYELMGIDPGSDFIRYFREFKLLPQNNSPHREAQGFFNTTLQHSYRYIGVGFGYEMIDPLIASSQ